VSKHSAYLVDPYLLQRPCPAEWGAAVDSILAWTAYGSSETRRFVLSSLCVSSLIKSGNCPYLNAFALHAILESEGEPSIPAPDLHMHVNRLLSEAQYWDGDVLIERFELKPQIVVTRQCAPEIMDGFASCLIAFHLTQTPETDNGLPPIASRPGDGLHDETHVQIAAHVLYAEGIQQEKLSFPLDVSSCSLLLFKPPAIPLDPTALIADAVSTLTKAYEIHVPEGDKNLYPLCDFSVGPSFVPSILKLHLESQAEVLRIIIKQAVRVLSRQGERFPSMAIHPQRAGPGSSDPQLVRPDGAAAFRAHLTKHGPGYRLLYWQKGSTYELWEVETESG
jgi:hypothetical protein